MAVEIECSYCGNENEIECEHDGTDEEDSCGCSEVNVDLSGEQCQNCYLHLEECGDCCSHCNCCPCEHKCSVCGECGESSYSNCECCTDCMQEECECNYCSECECDPCECICEDCATQPCICAKDTPMVVHPTDQPGNGQAKVAPWEERGVVVRCHGVKNVDYQEVWNLDTSVDMIAGMAEFYVLFGLSNRLVNTEELDDATLRYWYPVNPDPQLKLGELTWKASEAFDELVDRLDVVLRRYVNLAVGGELRYHRAIGGSVLPSKHGDNGAGNTRYQAWVGWKEVFETVGPEALKDAAKLFREINAGGAGGIGGNKWAMAAEILYWRLTDRHGTPVWHDENDHLDPHGPKPILPPKVFVDRVFNAQHNGGVLLNKVHWPGKNPRGWGIEHAKTTVLPAHDDNGETNWSLLVSLCTDPTRRLFEQVWAAANEVRKSVGLKAKPSPSTEIQYRWLCSYCNSNPLLGHHLSCSSIHAYDFNKGNLEPCFIGDSEGNLSFVENPSWVTKVPDHDWAGWNWKQWKAKEYPIGSDGSMTLDVNTACKIYVMASTYEVQSGNLVSEHKKNKWGDVYHQTTIGDALSQKLNLKGLQPSSYAPDRCTLKINFNVLGPHHLGEKYGEQENVLVSYHKRVKWAQVEALQGMTVTDLLKLYAPNFQPILVGTPETQQEKTEEAEEVKPEPKNGFDDDQYASTKPPKFTLTDYQDMASKHFAATSLQPQPKF